VTTIGQVFGTHTVRAPNANAFAGRWVVTVSRECLDHLLIVGPRHLARVLDTYMLHNNTHRPHRALWLRPRDPRSPSSERALPPAGGDRPPRGHRRAHSPIRPGRVTSSTSGTRRGADAIVPYSAPTRTSRVLNELTQRSSARLRREPLRHHASQMCSRQGQRMAQWSSPAAAHRFRPGRRLIFCEYSRRSPSLAGSRRSSMRRPS
jgi:hypothetical protein